MTMTDVGDPNNYTSYSTYTINDQTTTGGQKFWSSSPVMLGGGTQVIKPFTTTGTIATSIKVTINTGKRIPGGLVYQAITIGDLESIFYCYVFGSNHILINKISKEGVSTMIANEEIVFDTTIKDISDLIQRLISTFVASNETATPNVQYEELKFDKQEMFTPDMFTNQTATWTVDTTAKEIEGWQIGTWEHIKPSDNVSYESVSNE